MHTSVRSRYDVTDKRLSQCSCASLTDSQKADTRRWGNIAWHTQIVNIPDSFDIELFIEEIREHRKIWNTIAIYCTPTYRTNKITKSAIAFYVHNEK